VLPPLRRVLSVFALAALLISVVPNAISAASAASAAPHSTLQWTACGGGIECARLKVPLDDTVSGGPTISLAIGRVRARDPQYRIGSLVMNPGGPGAPGIQFLREFAPTLPGTIRDRFDLVSFDPRGTGASAPVECTPNLDSLYNLEFAPRDDAARQALVAGVRAFIAQCQAKAGAELPYVSTERAARDMDRIRAALGDKRLTYLGYSYGTYLGSLYADRYPSHIRAMVLDGAVDPALDAAAQQIQQAQGFEHGLDLFLQSCAADTTCSFHRGGNTAAAYDALRARIGATPIPATGTGKGRVLNDTEFDIGVTQFLYSGQQAWTDLAQALDAADHGDGSALLRQSDVYTGRHADGTYDQSQDAFLAIGCLDGPDLGGLAGLRSIEEQAAQVAPRVGRSVVNNSLACALWPVPVQTPPLPHAVSAPPIVVVGNTDDPATPLAWATGLSHELQSAVLLTVRSAQHTAYASGNTCVDTAINRYLIDVRPPAVGTRC
jgi:pimeloyl-ACP methyl ester carboxylesterase